MPVDWFAVANAGNVLASELSSILRKNGEGRLLSCSVKWEFAGAFGQSVRFVLRGEVVGGQVYCEVEAPREGFGNDLESLGKACEALTKRAMTVRAIEFV